MNKIIGDFSSIPSTRKACGYTSTGIESASPRYPSPSRYAEDGDSRDDVDPFLGSGMSLLAAQKMDGDRTVYGCELSPDYCEVILKRFTAFSGIEPILIDSL